MTGRHSVDDTVTAETIRSALMVAAKEASVVVVRSSHSTWIQEGASDDSPTKEDRGGA